MKNQYSLRIQRLRYAGLLFVLIACTLASAQTAGRLASQDRPILVQPNLTTPGSSPFHLTATITEIGDPNSKGEVEWFWAAPDKWRRTITTQDFSQTLIVNGDKTLDQHSDDYFPIGMERLITAIVDPEPLLNEWEPGKRAQTKANGASKENGVTCVAPGMCLVSPQGLVETVGGTGYSVAFTSYRGFHGKRVARSVTYAVGVGEGLRAEVTKLEDFKPADAGMFEIAEPTPLDKQLRSATVTERELRALAVSAPEIIWPQVLDGQTRGTAEFYIGVDETGQVREVLPVRTDNERSNDSARRQLGKWKFKPLEKNGVPLQSEGVLTFALDTRAYGPKEPLTDAEVRKLATNTVDPKFPDDAPAGGSCSLRVAIDEEGSIVEVIAGQGTPGLFGPCYDAIKQWKFKPIMENGQPRPYRAEIKFTVGAPKPPASTP